MNCWNSKISDPQRLILNLSDKIDLKGSDKYFTLSNLSIWYAFKNIKMLYKNDEAKNKNTLIFGNAGDKKNL